MNDRYAILEAQGYVYGVPTYESKSKTLTFVLTPKDGVLLPMIAKGELAKAFKSLLSAGVLIQAKAVPRQEIKTFLDGIRKISTVWEAKKLIVLSFKRTSLKQYENLDVLDGLMPEDDDYDDVGYVEPESWGRFSAKRQALKQKGGNDD